MDLTANCTRDGDVCKRHGSRWHEKEDVCDTQQVLALVAEKREAQFNQYGDNADLEDGTGPTESWLRPVSSYEAGRVEMEFRREYEWSEITYGKPTWMHLVREEVAEAFQEDDPDRLIEELIDVAGLCVSWVEKIRDRH